jgi:hypothetical protein
VHVGKNESGAAAMNLIESAISPLKSDAVTRANQEASALVARYSAKLEEVGFDLNIAAPYPKPSIGRVAYLSGLSKRQTYNMLVNHDKCSRCHGEPDTVAISSGLVAKFIKTAEEDAAAISKRRH